ncbi:UDP-glucuronosyltransferase 2B1 [Armadillidium vulgare]|nr:UDP-glucuronosyltransferase 2B1 [Armadillidium vulgare]
MTSLQEILSDSGIREAVKRRSLLMRDTPRKPKDEVAYWVEYVIRHRGAEHLRSPFVDMPWYKMYNVDVWIFVIIGRVLLILSTLLAFLDLSVAKKDEEKKQPSPVAAKTLSDLKKPLTYLESQQISVFADHDLLPSPGECEEESVEQIFDNS